MIGPSKVSSLVQAHCTWCCNEKAEVARCTSTECPLHACREGKGASKKAIVAKCIDCNPDRPGECPVPSCDLYQVHQECLSSDPRVFKTRASIDPNLGHIEADPDPGTERLPGHSPGVAPIENPIGIGASTGDRKSEENC